MDVFGSIAASVLRRRTIAHCVTRKAQISKYVLGFTAAVVLRRVTSESLAETLLFLNADFSARNISELPDEVDDT